MVNFYLNLLKKKKIKGIIELQVISYILSFIISFLFLIKIKKKKNFFILKKKNKKNNKNTQLMFQSFFFVKKNIYVIKIKKNRVT